MIEVIFDSGKKNQFVSVEKAEVFLFNLSESVNIYYQEEDLEIKFSFDPRSDSLRSKLGNILNRARNRINSSNY